METLTILKQILDTEMDLPTGRCFAYNGDQDLPKDDKLFICLYYTNRTPYYNNNQFKDDGVNLQEVQKIGLREDIEIAICSRNLDARNRSYEILMALRSIFSQQLQEKYHIHISTIGDIFDNSFLEATAMLNRFDIRISVMRSYEKIKNIDYYDKFSGSVWVENNYNDVTKNTL